MTTKSPKTYVYFNYGDTDSSGKPDFKLLGTFSNEQEQDEVNTRIIKEITRLYGDNWEYKGGRVTRSGSKAGDWSMIMTSSERTLTATLIEEAQREFSAGANAVAAMIGKLEAFGDNPKIREHIRNAYPVFTALHLVLAYRLEKDIAAETIAAQGVDADLMTKIVLDTYRESGLRGVFDMFKETEREA